MPTVMTYSQGAPCWADVQTPDVDASKSFYAAVFGWTYQDHPTPDGRSYAMAYVGPDLVASIAPQGPLQDPGSAAEWNVYLAADDAPGVAGEAGYAGGAVQFGPEDVGGTGVMVFLDPPGGGTTGVWQAGTHRGSGLHNEPGALSWAELLTPEPQAAVGFFQQLFGHEVTEYPQDDGGTYSTLTVDGAEVAGIAGDEGPAGWQVYFGVADLRAALEAVREAGGEVLVDPEGDYPEAPATIRDPQGGVLGIIQVHA